MPVSAASCEAGFSCSASKTCSTGGSYVCSGVDGCPTDVPSCAASPNPECKVYSPGGGTSSTSVSYESCCQAYTNGGCTPGQPCDPAAWPQVGYNPGAGGECSCSGDLFISGSCSVNWNGPTDPTTSYNCVNNSCELVANTSGTYTNIVSCRTSCGNTNPSGQFCSWCTNADQCFSSGGSFQGAGSGWCAAPDGGCCTQPAPPPPPPPSYSCQNDSCSYAGPSPAGQYLGNNCSGNCGIKCTVISNSGANVGSKDHNSNLCNLGTVTANNNPIQYKITCTAEGSGSRLWHVKSINVPDAGIVNFNSNQSVNNNLVNDSYLASNVNITNPLSGSQTGATTTKMLRYKFNMNTSLPKPADNKVICSNILPADTEPSLLVTYPAANYQEYVTQCYANSETEDNMNTSFSSTLSKANWGTISYNAGSNTFSESTGRIPYLSSTYILSASNTIQASKGANAIPAIAANSVTSNNYTFSSSDIGKVIIWDISKPTSVDVISAVDTINNIATVLTSDVRASTNSAILKFQDKTQVRMIVNKGVATTENGVTCTALTSYSSNINNTIDYETICTTDTLGTDALKTEVLRRINLTGYKSVTYSDPNYSEQIITVGNTPRFNSIYGNITQSSGNTSNTYTVDISLAVPDGLARASRNITVNISDNITTAPVNVTHLIDTSLPLVEREVSVTSATLLKVVHSATDDFQLKSHALYCGGTAYSSDTSTNSNFISETKSDGTTYLGSQQIAGYFDAVSNVKTCNGSFSSGNNNDYQVFNTSAVSDTRSTYYLLDDNAIKNQNEPISITFGNGKDSSSLGRWYAEDSFCNLPATSPTTTVDIGSPWLQTKGGNTYVQGTNGFSRLDPDIQAYNYTVNNVSIAPDPNNPALNICSSTIGSVTNNNLKTFINTRNTKSNAALSSYVNRINQCPEKDDSYVSTYALSSNEENSNTGPRGNPDRFSKITQAATFYTHKLNDVSKYTGGDKNLYDYLSKLIETSGILGYTNTGTAITDSNSPLYNGSGLSIKTISNSVSVDPASDKDLIKAIDPDVVENVSDKKVNVYKITGNLNVKHNTLANDGAWNINKNSILLVDGDVILEPDIIKNTGSLVIVAKGSIVIGNGSYKSENLTSAQVLAGTAYPLYDRIDAFLITDGKLVTLPDKGSSSNIQAIAPVKQIETVAKVTETKLNNDIVKKAEALNGYRCGVRFYKASNHTNPYVAGENIETGQDLYVWVGIQLGSPDFAYDDNDPDWQYTAFKNNGVRLNILAHDLTNGQHNYYMTVPGSSIVNGANVFQFGVRTNYNDRSDAITGDWCEPFTLTGVTTNNPPPVIPPTPTCTDMKINGGYDDVPIVLGSDINVEMTVSNPTDNSGMIRVNNRDNKCNSSRSFRAGLTPLSNPATYSTMDNSSTNPSNWQDCEPPATQTLTTTRFDNLSYVDNGNLRTYTYKIKPEQLLKVDVNTGKMVKSFELAGPAGYDDTLNCKVYAHDYKVVYDGLKIFGGVVQTSTFPKGNNLLGSTTISMDGSNFSNSLTCKNSGGNFPTSGGNPVNTGLGSPCFLRDLIMVQNFVAPAEQIEYDPSIQLVFGNILGRKSTILSIRESTTND